MGGASYVGKADVRIVRHVRSDRAGGRRCVGAGRDQTDDHGAGDGPTEGYETVELIIELDPNIESGWVIHPGTEGGVILEGGGELLIKGEPTVMSKPGTSWVLAAEAPHNLRNGPQATKLALTLTVQKGKPLTIQVPKPT